MNRRFSTNFAILSMFLDAILVAFSLQAAARMRPLLNFIPFTTDFRKPLDLPSGLYILFPVTWVLIFVLVSVYDGRRNLRVTDETSSVFLGSVLAGVSLAGMLYLSYRDISRVLFLAFVLLTLFALTSWRLLSRLIFRYAKGKGFAQRRVLIVGAGLNGLEFKEKIETQPYLGLSVVGFLDDNISKVQMDPEVLGNLDEVRPIIQEKQIDDVVIALPAYAHERLNQLVAELHELPVKVLVILDYFHQALHKARIEEFAGMPMLDLRAPALTDYQRLVKRGFDLVVCILVMPVSLVLMAVIALLIKLDGPGPILFRQKRVGENGRLFDMIKFRTMVPNAEDLLHLVELTDADGNIIHKSAADPRVTRIGRFLRKSSLDEIPQIFNVIVGDMSVIGPRPELPYLVEKYELWQRQRLTVQPGITGWWQVNGRSDRLMHLHTEDDIYYVQNYSLLLDIFILIKTVGIVLRGKGAY